MKGGVARAASRIASFLAQGGFQVYVCVFPESHMAIPHATEPDSSHITTRWTPLPSADNELVDLLERASAMAEVIRQLDADVHFDLFHGIFLPAAFPCLQVARRGRRPVIASARGSDATLWPSNSGSRSIIASVLRHAHTVTAPSRDSLNRLQAIEDIRDKSAIVPNSAAEPTAPWTLEAAHRHVVGTVAEFYPVKRIPLLIESYAMVPQVLRKQLLLVGDFPGKGDWQRAMDAIARLGVAHEVSVTGYVDASEVARHLRSMRVFVLTSEFEGFSNALLEAASMGVPVVSTQVGGVEELLAAAPEIPALLVADEAGLATAIARVLSSDDLAASLSAAARQAAHHFRPEREREKWLEVHQEALKGAPATLSR